MYAHVYIIAKSIQNNNTVTMCWYYFKQPIICQQFYVIIKKNTYILKILIFR